MFTLKHVSMRVFFYSFSFTLFFLFHFLNHDVGISSVLLYRESLSETIITALGNYRHKRVLGLASIFGDQYVTSECVKKSNHSLE